jgi:E3 ubiquitin-protein ligase UBR1
VRHRDSSRSSDGEQKKYVTMMFNDEAHTYDQVINVLTRAINCSKDEGHELASLVDREGRTAIRVGTMEECQKAEAIVRQRTSESPLKCVIYPSSFISLQHFAQRILQFLQETIAVSDGFRRIFCEIEMTESDRVDVTLTDKVLLSEKLLWKSARSALHQIFINRCVFVRRFSVLNLRFVSR